MWKFFWAALKQDVVGPAAISRTSLTYPLFFMFVMAVYIVGYMEAFGDNFLHAYAEKFSLSVEQAAAAVDANL